MSEAIDFNGVEEAVSNLKPMTSPGVGVFTISSLEFTSNSKGNPFVWIRFENEETSFRHQFYLTKASLGRLQHLAVAITGKALTGQLTSENLEAIFTGKKVRLCVIGTKRQTGKGERIYADLAFTNFAENASTETKFVAGDVYVRDDKTKPESNTSFSVSEPQKPDNDLPF